MYESVFAAFTLQFVINRGALSGWSSWSAWSLCTVTCGTGTETKTRSCIGVMVSDCKGAREFTRYCNRSLCNEGWHWGEWSSWSECSSSCGVGTRSRTICAQEIPPDREYNCSKNLHRANEICRLGPCPTTSSQTSQPTTAELGNLLTTVQVSKPSSMVPTSLPDIAHSFSITTELSSAQKPTYSLTTHSMSIFTSSKSAKSTSTKKESLDAVSTTNFPRRNNNAVQNTVTVFHSTVLMTTTSKPKLTTAGLNRTTKITEYKASVIKHIMVPANEESKTLIITVTSSVSMILVLVGVIVSSIISFKDSRIKKTIEVDDSQTSQKEFSSINYEQA